MVKTMSKISMRIAAILLFLLPTVAFGGVSILSLLITDPAYAENALRQDLWRAGHAHAGVLLILSLVALRYVDDARLTPGWTHVGRLAIPTAAILMSAGFFFSVLTPEATSPNAFIYLVYLGGVSLTVGLIVLGVGLWRAGRAS
jgi:hypothetical protein